MLLHVQEPPDGGAFGSPMDFRQMDEESDEEGGTECMDEPLPSSQLPASSWALSLWTAGRDGSSRGKGEGEDAASRKAPEVAKQPATAPSLLALQRFPPLRQLLPAPEECKNLALIVYTGPPDIEDCHAGGGRKGGKVVARPTVQPMAVKEETCADDDAMLLD